MTQFIITYMKMESGPRRSLRIAFKKSKATKCSNHCTYSKKVVRIQRRTERKIEDAPGDDQFGFRTGKGTK
jgi:hypothetical protein